MAAQTALKPPTWVFVHRLRVLFGGSGGGDVGFGFLICGEANNDHNWVFGGRQDEATEPHPPKTRATNFWP